MSGSRRHLLRYAATWLLVVSVTAGLSWGAIARAGAAASLLGAPAPLGSVTAAGPAPTATPPLPDVTARPTTSASTSSEHPSTSPSATQSTTRSTTSSTTRSTAPSAEPTRSGVQSFSTAAGQVWAYCIGSTPHIRSVVATEGWRFEIATEDAGRIEVKFAPPGGNDHDGEVEVRVRCQSGSPSFSTE